MKKAIIKITLATTFFTCKICGELSSNLIAVDDNPLKLMSLAMKTVADPPFPLDKIEEMTKLIGCDGKLIW